MTREIKAHYAEEILKLTHPWVPFMKRTARVMQKDYRIANARPFIAYMDARAIRQCEKLTGFIAIV